MTLLTGWPLDLTVDDILRGQGMNVEAVRTGKPVLIASAEKALQEGLSLLHPVAVIRESGVHAHRHNRIILETGEEITGPLAARHLAGAQQIFAVVCTIGPELEHTASRLLSEEPLRALTLDGLGNAAVECLSQQICAHIGEQIATTGQTASTPLSPGSQDWPVEVGQQEIFSLLDVTTAGITLTSAGMMVPKKSMSFVVGVGPDMSQTGLCVVCNLKDTCRFQHD